MMAYAAVEAADAWSGFLGALSVRLGAQGVGLTSPRGAAELDGVELEWHGLEGECLQEYASHFWRLDPWAEPAHQRWDLERSELNGAPSLRPLRSDDLTHRPSLERSEFGVDFMKRHDIVDLCQLPLTPAGDSRRVVLAATRTRCAGTFGSEEVATLAALSPHLRQAFRLRRSFSTLDGASHDEQSWPSRSPIGILLLSGDNRVLRCNEAAEALLRSGEVLSVLSGKLVGSSQAVEERLAAVLAQVRRSPADPKPTRLTDRVCVVISTHVSASGLVPVPGEAQLVLYLLRVGRRFLPQDPRFGDAFGLSATEAKVAHLVAQSLAPKEVAIALGMSWNTVRAHLRSVFRKTSVENQAQLASLYRDFCCIPSK